MTSPPDPAAPGPGFAWELPQQLPVPPEVEVLTPPGAQDTRPSALRSRNNVVAVVVLGLVLALGLGMGSWVLLGSPWFPAPATNGRPVVAGLSQEPTIAWNLQLDGPSEEVTAVGDDAMAVFDTDDPTAGLRLLSLVDGKALWETKLDEMPSGSDAQIWARWFRGTDRIIVDSFEPGSTTKTIAYLDVKTGEHLGVYRLDPQASVVAADDGSPILLSTAGEAATISLLRSWDPADARWTQRSEALMGDGDRKFVVQNGTLLVGQDDFGVHVSATYCDAFAAKTGERPLWLEPDSCFQSVGSDTLLFQGQDGSWVMKGRDGSVRWTHEGDEQEFQAVGDELYLIQRSGRNSVRRYDPADGKQLWTQAALFDGYVALARHEGQLFALISDEKSMIARLDAANGDVLARIPQPSSFPQFLQGQGQILAMSVAPEGVEIAATAMGEDRTLWTSRFPDYSSGFQAGRYLVLRDSESHVISVLG